MYRFDTDGRICTLLPVAVCRIHRLLPLSETTCTTYLPSGEIAASDALPLEVRRLIAIVSGVDADAGGRARMTAYAPMDATTAAATPTAIGIMNDRVLVTAGAPAINSPDVRSSFSVCRSLRRSFAV